MPGENTLTVTELLAQLNAHYAEDERGVLKELENTSIDVIKTFRSKSFANGKKEGQKDEKGLADKLAEAETQLETLTGQLEEMKQKTPNVAEEVKKASDKLAAEIKKREEKIAALTSKLKSGSTERALNRFAKFLSGRPEEFATEYKGLDLGGVKEKYATRVATLEVRDQLILDDDGEVIGVRKPGEQTEYDGATLDEKLARLAADVRKKVDPDFLTSNVGAGSGVRAGGGSPGANTATIVEQKRGTGDYVSL